MIEIGENLPSAVFTIITAEGVQKLSADNVFAGKRAALFAVPGAFTPTCSARHLPGYRDKVAELRAKGVELIACTAVNDHFVMSAWAKESGVGEDIMMLADGNADFARACGLDADMSGFGMGLRSRRYSMLLRDGVIERINVEAPGEYKVSSAEYLLAQLE
jgi:glutaredoxin/glutathione-dependent peroxiredoxin